MSNEIFIIGKNHFLHNGLREIIREGFSGKKSRFTIRQVNLVELMQIDASYKTKKRYSIAIVPAHMYETLHIFAGMEQIKMVPGNLSLADINALLSEVVASDISQSRVNANNSLCLTAKERRYCYLVYSGISNKKIARYFQCTEKNVSYLKRKIMSKWQCKNSLDFYKTINYFYAESDEVHGESAAI
ncbi:helix-turn-helix transcriptional regulator [Pantoea sp. C2G6]